MDKFLRKFGIELDRDEKLGVVVITIGLQLLQGWSEASIVPFWAGSLFTVFLSVFR